MRSVKNLIGAGDGTTKVGRSGRNFEISGFDIAEVSKHDCLRKSVWDLKKYRTSANFDRPQFDIAKFNCITSGRPVFMEY